MNHNEVLSGLRSLINEDLFGIPPEEHMKHLYGENDRVFIILHGATLEDILKNYLSEALNRLDENERKNVLSHNGIAGTFAARLTLAKAFGIVDVTTYKRCEIIKSMRNTAAHSHARISFETPEMQAAVRYLFLPDVQQKFTDWTEADYRRAFGMICVLTQHSFAKRVKPTFTVKETYQTIEGQRLKKLTR